MSLEETELKYFEEILNKYSIKNGNCIEWTGKTCQGYGYFQAFKKTWRTHRIAYLIKHKKIEKDLYICHRCNNKKCINVDHLYAGTPKDNTADWKNSPNFRKAINQSVDIRKKNIKKREKEFQKYLDGYLTIQEFSEILHCHRNTILKSIHTGHLQAIRTGCGSRSSFRIHKSEFERLGIFSLNETIEKIIEKKEKVLKS